jgi:Tfp pilus assembly protein PilN
VCSSDLEEKQVTDQKIRALERISVDREKWVRLLEVFSGSLPTYAWLIAVRDNVGPPEKIVVDARTYSFPEVAQYMSKLEEAEYIKSVTLAGIEQVQGHDRKVYRFNLDCEINADVGLGPVVVDGEEKVSNDVAAKGNASTGRRRGRANADDGGKK